MPPWTMTERNSDSLFERLTSWLRLERQHGVMRLLLAFGCGFLWGQGATAQDVEVVSQHYGFCVSCHGIEGRSGKPLYPILAGQRADYLVQQLNDFKNGLRRDPNMIPVVQTLDERSIRALATFFSSREMGGNRFAGDNDKVARGKRRAEFQCRGCHHAEISSGITAGAGRVVPRIDGQNYSYLVKQLGDFRLHRRDNDGGPMQAIANTLSDKDIDDLASYFGSVLSPPQARVPMVQLR